MSDRNKKTVMTQHPEYKAMHTKWSRCRDVSNGQDAMRKNSMNYIPMLIDQPPDAYKCYVDRATFFNATWRTISGLRGMMFRKPETIEVPEKAKAYLKDITMAGEPLHIFSQELAKECMKVGRAGILVDYPVIQTGGVLTVAMAERLGLRPTMQRYTAESIINWRTSSIGNISKLSMVVLAEQYNERIDDFTDEEGTQYRVLDLVSSASDPTTMIYRVRIFRINRQSDAQEQIGTDRFPMLDGQPMPGIPFFFAGVDSVTPSCELPPLLDLVDLNIAHYRVSADYENGCHMSGVPTAWVAGYQTNDGEKLYVGSGSAWVFPEAATHCGYLEVSGGFGALENNLDKKEQQMAALGARLLTADRRSNETATTAAIHHGGETAVLSAIAQVLSLTIQSALKVFCAWAGADGEVKYEINRDFFPLQMDSATLQSLVAAWQAGAISAEVLFQNLQEGEIINSYSTFEMEQAKIANSPPISSKMTTNMVVNQQNNGQ